MTAFVMRLPGALPGDAYNRLMDWCKARCTGHRVKGGVEETLCGGVFLESCVPRDLAHFRRLMVTNLKNWGVERQSHLYKRGWLQFVEQMEYDMLLTTPEERAALEQKHKEQLAAEEAAAAEAKRQARDLRVDRGVKILRRLVNRHLQGAVDKLAVEIHKRQAAAAEARRAKQSAFNEERYGLPGVYVRYSPEELECESWQAVKRRRLDHPQPAWKEYEDAKLARTACERARAACSDGVVLS
jgi:hypothetical protein